MKVLALVALFFFSAACALAQQPLPSACVVNFTVGIQDTLKNIHMGLTGKELEWAQKLQQKYPGVCYVAPQGSPHAVLFITVVPDTYHGMKTVNETSTTTGSSGSSSTTSSHEEPYSVDYGIYTLLIERPNADGSLTILQTFRQKGLYTQIYGIPLGGRGHHPSHAVIEDAVKWLSAGGLSDPNQSSNLISGNIKP